MIYLIHGDEEFLRAEALAEIQAALGPAEFAQLNTTEIDGTRFTLADIHHACDAMPFLAPRRLVILNAALTALARKEQRSQRKGRSENDSESGSVAGRETGEAFDKLRPRAVSLTSASLRRERGSTETSASSVESLVEVSVERSVEPSNRTQAANASLIAYLPQLPDTTDLVLLEPAQVRKTDPVLKALEALAQAQRARLLLCQYDGPWWKQDEWLLNWLTQRARQRKIKIEPAAVQALAELVGHNLRLLDQELSKLLAYSANARAISAADVKLLVSGARERSVFEMVEALAGGNHKQAVALLQSLLDAGEQPLGILGMIAWQYRLLLQVKEQMSQGHSQEAAGAALGQKPFTMKKAWPQAQRFSLATLEWVMERLLDTDIAIKTGQMEDRLALTVLISELSQRR